MSADAPICLLDSSDEEEEAAPPQQRVQRHIAVPGGGQSQQEPSTTQEAASSNGSSINVAAAAASQDDTSFGAVTDSGSAASLSRKTTKKRAVLTSVAAPCSRSSSSTVPAAASSSGHNGAVPSGRDLSSLPQVVAGSGSTSLDGKTKKRAVLTSAAPLSRPLPSSTGAGPLKRPPSYSAAPAPASTEENSNDDQDQAMEEEEDTNLASLQAFAMSRDDDDSDDTDGYDSDPNNDDFVDRILGQEPQSLKDLQRHCWVCRSWIEHPNKVESKSSSKANFHSNEMEYCCYLQHEHPSLSVPVCIVCSEKVEDAVPSPPASPTREPQAVEHHTVCGGCGRDATEDLNTTWASCNECPRAFCQHCLVQAHCNAGIMKQMRESKGPWKCLCCAPPVFLRQLQKHTSNLQAEADQAIAAFAEKKRKSESGVLSGSEEAKLCELLGYLEMVEEKKAECDETLDDDGNLDAGAKTLWKEHRLRLVDTIATIQDKLKSEYDIETLKVYREIQGPERISCLQEDDEPPQWKRMADKEIAKREKESRKMTPKEDGDFDPNDKRYRIEIASDVDDLSDVEDDGGNGGDSDDSYAKFRAGWRHSQYKPSQWAIDEALDAEDERFLERHIVTKSRHRVDDAKEMENWATALKPPKRRRQKRPRQDDKPLSSSNVTKEFSLKQSSVKRRSLDTELPSSSSDDDMRLDAASQGSVRKKASPLVLCRRPKIAVAFEMATELKKHQRQGIKFMYENTFADLGGDPEAEIGGSILAHSMGLGKSFSVIALLHTVMLLDDTTIRKVLLIVPVNTLANWEDQFEKWQHNSKEKLNVFMPGSGDAPFRKKVIKKWNEKKGVLLMSDGLFRNSMNIPESKASLVAADAIILDESHTMLKTKGNKLFKALNEVKTPRRICLTGTPFQNNLMEYFRMLSYIRPGLLGTSEPQFQKNYADPISAGLAADAMESIKLYADELITNLKAETGPYVHRRDAKVLVADLPPLQQAVLHVRPTPMQRSAYRSYRKYQRATGQKNFLHQFASLRPTHNHPGTILYRESEADSKKAKGSKAASKKTEQEQQQEKRQSNPNIKAEKNGGSNGGKAPYDEGIIDLLSSDEDEDVTKEDEADDAAGDGHWSGALRKKYSDAELQDPAHGNKCILLLHILMQAQTVGDKTLVFSQSLATLDFLENMLASNDWAKMVPSLQASFPGKKMGGWRANRDFVRLDGSTSGGARGEMINDFESCPSIKLFLISVGAGSLGINLTSANRVVLMDSHFNPSVDLQAIYRTYRYGQTKPVYCYRLLTQGSMEEKVYSRAVTKSSLAGSVVDGKAFLRCFNKKELDSLARTDVWAECCKCKRWRMFPADSGVEEATIKSEENWRCEMMNEYDLRMKWTCSISDKESDWYSEHYKKPNRPLNEKKASTSQLIDALPGRLRDEKAKELVEKDAILKNLLGVVAKDKPIVSKHYFHDALFTDQDAAGTEKDKESGKKSPRKKSAAKSTPKRKQQKDPEAGSRNSAPRKKGKLSETIEALANDASARLPQNANAAALSNDQQAEPHKSPPKKARVAAESSARATTASPANPQEDQKKAAAMRTVQHNFEF
ncbi:MAG: hypothetical protein SGILL_000682 [Bacillariaceae sp.]